MAQDGPKSAGLFVTRLSEGLVARVRHLRGEDKLRHATIQSLGPKEGKPDDLEGRHLKEESDLQRAGADLARHDISLGYTLPPAADSITEL